jgi:hypothetical protein
MHGKVTASLLYLFVASDLRNPAIRSYTYYVVLSKFGKNVAICLRRPLPWRPTILYCKEKNNSDNRGTASIAVEPFYQMGKDKGEIYRAEIPPLNQLLFNSNETRKSLGIRIQRWYLTHRIQICAEELSAVRFIIELIWLRFYKLPTTS